MNDKIQRIPAGVQLFERRIQRCVVGYIHIHHEIRPNGFRQRLKTLTKRLALIGKGKLCPRFGTGLGNAPRNRAFVGHAHNQPAFAA